MKKILVLSLCAVFGLSSLAVAADDFSSELIGVFRNFYLSNVDELNEGGWKVENMNDDEEIVRVGVDYMALFAVSHKGALPPNLRMWITSVCLKMQKYVRDVMEKDSFMVNVGGKEEDFMKLDCNMGSIDLFKCSLPAAIKMSAVQAKKEKMDIMYELARQKCGFVGSGYRTMLKHGTENSTVECSEDGRCVVNQEVYVEEYTHMVFCCMVDVGTQDVNVVTRVGAHAKTELSHFDKDCKLVEK